MSDDVINATLRRARELADDHGRHCNFASDDDEDDAVRLLPRLAKAVEIALDEMAEHQPDLPAAPTSFCLRCGMVWPCGYGKARQQIAEALEGR